MAFGIVKKVIATCDIPGQHSIKLLQMTDQFYRCEYGGDVYIAMTLDVALDRFREAITHASTCAGLLDV